MFSNIIKILVRYISSSQGSANSAKENHQTAQPSSSQSCRNRSNQKQPVLEAAFQREPEVVRARSSQSPSQSLQKPVAARARNNQSHKKKFSVLFLLPTFVLRKSRDKIIKVFSFLRNLKSRSKSGAGKLISQSITYSDQNISEIISLVIILVWSVIFPTEIVLPVMNQYGKVKVVSNGALEIANKNGCFS